MRFHNYIVDVTRGSLRQLDPADAGQVTAELTDVCRMAMDDPAEIEQTGCGLRVRWTAEPGCLSCWVDDVPVRTCLFLVDAHERHTLHALYETAAPVFADVGVELGSDWVKQDIEFPCVVAMPLPFGSPQGQQVARDLSQNWAIAYFDQKS